MKDGIRQTFWRARLSARISQDSLGCKWQKPNSHYLSKMAVYWRMYLQYLWMDTDFRQGWTQVLKRSHRNYDTYDLRLLRLVLLWTVKSLHSLLLQQKWSLAVRDHTLLAQKSEWEEGLSLCKCISLSEEFPSVLVFVTCLPLQESLLHENRAPRSQAQVWGERRGEQVVPSSRRRMGVKYPSGCTEGWLGGAAMTSPNFHLKCIC